MTAPLTRVRSKATIFLALTFGSSWVAAFLGYWLLQRGHPSAAQAALIFTMAGPGISGIACALLLDRGRFLEALGIRFRPNWWWLLAYATGVAFSGIALATNIFAGDGVLSVPPGVPQFALSFLLINPVVQTVLATLEEELGWRGYLYSLWREQGFWRCSLGTGFVWGVWHVPGIILFKIGSDLPWVGAAILVLLCMLFAPLVTLARDRGGSVIAAGILHGVANATEIASTMLVKSSSPLWQGDAGLGGVIAATFFVLVIVAFRRYSGRAVLREA